MKTMNKVLAGLLLASASAVPLMAADFPEKPVTMIVAYSPGGGNDTVARLMAQHIEPYLGTRMVVENQAGAGGQVGFTRLARAKDDGYTIGLLSAPSIFMIELLREGVAFSQDDFQPLANIQSDPILLTVNADSDLTDFAALKAEIESKPGSVNIAGDGPQSNVHLQAAAFEKTLGQDINFVSYAGSGPSATALLGNEVQAALLTTSSALQFVNAGKLRALGVFSPDRHPSLPDVPTISELSGENMPGVGTAIRGVVSPAGVDADRVAHLSGAFEQLLQDEAFIAAADNAGIVLTYMGAEEFSGLLGETMAETRQFITLME